MESYFIYHIPGKKFGCSINPKMRVHKQGYSDTDWYVHEVHTDIEVASQREHDLNVEYGYPVDNKLYKDLKFIRKENTVPAGHKGAKAVKENGKIRNFQVAGGKVQGKVQGKKNAQRIGTCPHCGKTGPFLGLIRVHLDRCKFKKQSV